jgi:glycosyltransferase involved in cell wall biosynthesis
MPPSISVAIITLNEEENIRECLESVSWADEIVVVDSGSTDRTVEIAKELTARVIHNDWPGYVAQKNFALDATTGEWVLCLDADERCTPELQKAILEALEKPGDADGFAMRRHVRYLGRWINHGGWYPDWKVRLVRREKARWGGTDPHDRLETGGPVRELDAELVHYTYRDFAHQIRTVNRFSDVAAEEWMKAGRSFSLVRALLHPPAKFFECYIWKRGFLDGWPGFVIALTSSFYVYAKYVKLRERDRQARGPDA